MPDLLSEGSASSAAKNLCSMDGGRGFLAMSFLLDPNIINAPDARADQGFRTVGAKIVIQNTIVPSLTLRERVGRVSIILEEG